MMWSTAAAAEIEHHLLGRCLLRLSLLVLSFFNRQCTLSSTNTKDKKNKIVAVLYESDNQTSYQISSVTVSQCTRYANTSVTHKFPLILKMSTNTDAKVKLKQLDLDDYATISDPATLSDYSGDPMSFKLVRNGNVDTATDYIHIFMKLQLREDFEEEFFEITKEFRSREHVREALEDPDNDLKEVSEDFLQTYGKKIWMYKGPNNHQDPKYRETFFKWKDDKDK